MAYGYQKDVNYQQEINQALAAQDYRTAAIREAQRNEKIIGEGMEGKYPTTNHYAAYLPKTDQVNSGIEQLAGSRWSYDVNRDPAYQAYAKQYLREADRQTRDTLAAYAGQTGGIPSTAAVGAAQQAGSYQRAQLTDKIPELMQADFSRWAAQQDNQRANLNLLQGIDSQRAADSLALQKQAYQQAVDRWTVLGYADEQVAQALGVPVGATTADQQYRAWQQQLTEDQWDWQKQGDLWDRSFRQAQFDWEKEGDLWDRSFRQSQFDWEKESDQWQRDFQERQFTADQEAEQWSRDNQAKQQEISRAMSQWSYLGYADEYVASVLGVPVGTSTSDAKYQQAQLQQATQAQAYERAMVYISMGIVPDSSLLTQAGISAADAQRLASKYAAQMAGSYTGGSSGGSSGSSRGSSSRSSSSSRGSGSSSSKGSGSGSGSGSGDGDGNKPKEQKYGKGVDETTYKGLRQTIYYAKQANNRAAAVRAMDNYVDKLSKSQYEDLMGYITQLFGQGGHDD